MGRCGDSNQNLDVQEDVMTAARCYIMSLYERSDFGDDLDALPVSLLISKEICVDCHYTKYAFPLHLRPAMLQLAVQEVEL